MEPYYADGTVSLYLGDCRTVLPALGITADVMVTDPPYGYAHSSHWAGKFQDAVIANDGDTTARDAVLSWWGDRPALVFGSWKRPRPAGTRMVLAWDKGDAVGMGDLSIPWKPNWEEIYVLGKGFSGPRTTGVLSGYRVVTWASMGRLHPNEKPVSLLHELLRKCPPGVVLDPFAGSGSTLLAARNLDRDAIGIEIEERWCEETAKRLSQGDLFAS